MKPRGYVFYRYFQSSSGRGISGFQEERSILIYFVDEGTCHSLDSPQSKDWDKNRVLYLGSDPRKQAWGNVRVRKRKRGWYQGCCRKRRLDFSGTSWNTYLSKISSHRIEVRDIYLAFLISPWVEGCTWDSPDFTCTWAKQASVASEKAFWQNTERWMTCLDLGHGHPEGSLSSHGFQLKFSMSRAICYGTPEVSATKSEVETTLKLESKAWVPAHNCTNFQHLTASFSFLIQKMEIISGHTVWKIWNQAQCASERSELAGSQGVSEGILHNPWRLGFSLSWQWYLLPRQSLLTKLMKTAWKFINLSEYGEDC